MAIRKRYLVEGKSSGGKGGMFLKINPLRGPAARRRRMNIFKIILGIIAISGFLSLLGGAGIFFYFSKDLPDPANLGRREVTESTKIYDRTGQVLLYEVHGEEKRTVVRLDQISPFLKKATIATEDKNFYSHEGVDLRGILRAIWRDIVTRDLRQGGSTITQQLVKNSILTGERTFTRKIKEWILSVELEQKFSKDQILEMYLNQIPYGSSAYGIEAASQTFFGKSAKDLTLGESAILAVLPKATTYYSPYGNHQNELKDRAKAVIKNMQDQGYVTEAEAKAAEEENALEKKKPFKEKIIAPHFVMMVKEYLADKYGDKILEKGGLKVITSLDIAKQQIAESAVKDNIGKNTKKYNVYNASLTAVDPKNGQLLALVGSKDYFGESLPAGCVPGKTCLFEPNVNAAVSSLPPGSAFKPFVYATLFKKGYTPDTMLFDVDTEFNIGCTYEHKPDGPYAKASDCYGPKNYDGKFRGPVNIRSALAQSLNIPAVKALYLAGIDESIQTANDFGITTMDKKDKYGLALVLGGGGVKLVELTAAYGALATEGIKNDLTMVLKVSSADGNILEDNSSLKKEGKKVLDPNIAREITDILIDNEARTPTFGAASPLYFSDRPVAAKTGTANDYRDAWTFGYTPSLVAGVWAGNNDYSPMNKAGGVSAAAPIWHDFMAKVLAGTKPEEFIKPEIKPTGKAMLDGNFDAGVTVKIDKACGDKLAKEDVPLDRIEEKVYRSIHNILYYVDKNDPLGPEPPDPKVDPQYWNWEHPASVWAVDNGYTNENPPTEYCEVQNYERPRISIIAPRNGENIKPMVKGDMAGFNLTIEADVFMPLGVNQANFFFDDALIGTRSNTPWMVNMAIGKNIASGAHKISVRVFDKANREIKDEVNISLDLDFDPPKISMKEPLCNKPYCFLSAIATDEKSTVAEVEFYFQKVGSYFPTKITGMVSADNDFYQIMWQTDNLESGSYEVWSTAKDDRGNQAVSVKKRLQI